MFVTIPNSKLSGMKGDREVITFLTTNVEFDQRVSIQRIKRKHVHAMTMAQSLFQMMMSICRGTLLFMMFFFVKSELYLSDTEDGLQLEYYDCFHVQSLSYCRRPDLPIDLIRDNDTSSCQGNGGHLHRFSQLRSKKTTISTILHQWRSGLERVEEYSRYQRNITAKDGVLCQCLQPGSFGKNCEYRLTFARTFEQTLNWQVSTRISNPVQVQIYGDIVCYKTLNCNSGLLCLDWREICDGIQNCILGRDEENCDLLEMNQCDPENEYRCMNGMCIPQEFFLDGEFDCLDWSDEIQFKDSGDCATEKVSPECDDHLCPPNEWSCGDGQCIHDRLAFRLEADYTTCHNRRDQYFMCETHLHPLSWTMPNGRCHEGNQYKAPSMLTNVDDEEKCLYLLRCALSRGGEAGCPCFRNSTCTVYLRQECSTQWLEYPKGALIASYMFFVFEIEPTAHIESMLEPWISINGTIRCRDSLISQSGWYLSGYNRNVGRRIHDSLCRKHFGIPDAEDFIGVQECSRPNESTDICNEWNRCLSITRLKDGFLNCLNSNDEFNQNEPDIEKSCSRVRRHRFRCSPTQTRCLSVMALGNAKLDCENGSDEFWFRTNRRLSQIRCNSRRKDECSHLRRYIEQSGNSINQEERIDKSVLPFRFYCDTFSDLDAAEDENSSECRESWVCASDQARCPTGHCIEQQWVSDSEWDCSDAVDENRTLDRIAKTVQQRATSMYFSDNQSSILSNTCNQTSSFLCLSPQLLRHEFLCIDQSQIGDGQVDCAGAIDERNTIKYCLGSSTLGNNFKCASTNTCIPFYFHCQEDFRCPNLTDDDSWCSRPNKSSTCQNVNDFMCLNGTCVMDGRCNRVHDCPFVEDEYMCDYPSSSKRKIISYREQKELRGDTQRRAFLLSRLPADAHLTDPIMTTNMTEQLASTISPIHLSSLSSYWCNRGMGILSRNNSIICFCPPEYFGEKCEYHNDRLSVVLHLNLSQSISTIERDPQIVVKLVVLFFFKNQTLMIEEFPVRISLEMKTTLVKKKIVHLLYSHSSNLREERREQYFNRSKILTDHPYSVQIEIYELRRLERPFFLAVWKYPIFFGYLPVFRLAKVLHLTKTNEEPNPCSNHSCHPNAECHPLLNNESSKIICLCKSNFTGENCEIEEKQYLSDYCAQGSLCKPNYRRLLLGNVFPYCICPSGRFGDQCDLEYDSCESNPCLNGGSCLPSLRTDEVFCLCPKEYHGLKCQLNKSSIRLSLDIDVPKAGSLIQFFDFDFDFSSFDLRLVHQQALKGVPSSIEYLREEKTVPPIVLAQLYSSSSEDLSQDFHILSLLINVESIDGRTKISEKNRCFHVRERFNGKTSLFFDECFV